MIHLTLALPVTESKNGPRPALVQPPGAVITHFALPVLSG